MEWLSRLRSVSSEHMSQIWASTPPSLPDMRLAKPDDNSPKNPLMLQFFTWDSAPGKSQMSWWKHFEAQVPKLAEMGITQVWLPPPNKGMNSKGRGYDAYDLWDLGEFNQKGTVATRWGTKDELVQATNVANTHGIDIIIDAVLNHKLGADRKETVTATPVHPDNRLIEIGPARPIEGWTAYEFPGRGDKYSELRWSEQHFTGVDWDARTKSKGVYRFSGDGHKGWSKRVDNELGNYDYLLGADIDHRHPAVRSDILEWGPWVLSTIGGAGFRLDAVKHMDYEFVKEFIEQTRRETGRQDMFVVGEYWSPNAKRIQHYIRHFGGTMAFFDVPLHDNFHRASRSGSRYDLRTILNGTLTKNRPGDAVTFVDNHDTQIGQTLESWVEKSFKLQAYALILLRGVGHPCVFYGDLYPNDECYDPEISNALKQLILARKEFAYGALRDYFLHKNCIGFVRLGGEKRGGCAVVLSNVTADNNRSGNAVDQKLHMNVGKNEGGVQYRSFLNQTASGVVDIAKDGWGTFPCSSSGVEVWVTGNS